MLIEDLKSIFGDWKTRDFSDCGIEFGERFEPEFDPHDDYRVIYEASFAPLALDKARIEFWITDTGYVAVGIETHERIGRRLGLKTIRHGFAGGHEPRTGRLECLQELFSAVTEGRISIGIMSLLGLVTSAKIYVAEADFDAMVRAGRHYSDWLSPISPSQSGHLPFASRRLVRYQAW